MATPYRADHVGSLLRPPELLEARVRLQRGQDHARSSSRRWRTPPCSRRWSCRSRQAWASSRRASTGARAGAAACARRCRRAGAGRDAHREPRAARVAGPARRAGEPQHELRRRQRHGRGAGGAPDRAGAAHRRRRGRVPQGARARPLEDHDARRALRRLAALASRRHRPALHVASASSSTRSSGCCSGEVDALIDDGVLVHPARLAALRRADHRRRRCGSA